MELNELLGIDETDPVAMLARDLVREHSALMQALVKLRRENYTQQEIADRLGVSRPAVAAFERYDADPRLSTVRRYALAVRAIVRHSVNPVAEEKAGRYLDRAPLAMMGSLHEHETIQPSHGEFRRLLKR